MATFVSEGKSALIIAPKNLVKGEFVLVGALFGVATEWTQKGAEVGIHLSGIFEVEKDESVNWNAGDKLYWDSDNSTFTIRKSDNAFVAVALSGQGARGLVRIFGLAIRDTAVPQVV